MAMSAFRMCNLRARERNEAKYEISCLPFVNFAEELRGWGEVMNTSLDPSQSLSHVQWRATEFILAFGALTLENVMDYFVLSPFFDKSSNNAVMRMQMMYSRGGLQGLNEEEELTFVSYFASFRS